MSECLKGKRVASRSNTGSNIEYQCIKSMARQKYIWEKNLLKNLY